MMISNKKLKKLIKDSIVLNVNSETDFLAIILDEPMDRVECDDLAADLDGFLGIKAVLLPKCEIKLLKIKGDVTT